MAQAVPQFNWSTCADTSYDACLSVTFDDGATDVALLKEQDPAGSCNYFGNLQTDTTTEVVATGACVGSSDDIYVSINPHYSHSVALL